MPSRSNCSGTFCDNARCVQPDWASPRSHSVPSCSTTHKRVVAASPLASHCGEHHHLASFRGNTLQYQTVTTRANKLPTSFPISFITPPQPRPFQLTFSCAVLMHKVHQNFTLSTGVSGIMPWPRLKIWPPRPATSPNSCPAWFAMACCSAHSTWDPGYLVPPCIQVVPR